EDRPGYEELLGLGIPHDIFNRQTERRDRELARGVERDERPAFVNELLERQRAFGTKPTRVFGRHRAGRVTVHQPLGALVRNDDRVEARAEPPTADLLIVQRLEGELVLFEQVARP